MFASRIIRNAAPLGTRMPTGANPLDRQMLFGAAGLAALTGLVYYTGYKAEGTSKAAQEIRKQREAEAALQRTPAI
ncbi:hypothetical protein D9619_008178 [Psilocybe cf. subviscida]|uniref:Uncharacterized protein n=1 Tax=Psilocybe cf. subviscida TaxID=2480587 RepID=A0A8H5ATU5_9AGAR|nr:hypothetical protein D9619_008178 [Psilocybe cf. subviscida]